MKKTRHFIKLTLAICCSYYFLCNLAVSADGKPEAGKTKSAACQGCHGEDGNSYSPEWPNLASQHGAYLSKQIKNFRDGIRKNETMNAMAAGLSDQDAEDIARYFAGQSLKSQAMDIDSELLKTGRKIYKGGNAYNGVPACAGCHGPNGRGNSLAVFPHVAGQRQTYLVNTLNEFRTGARNNDVNEIMRNIASRMTENEINAVAAYMSSLQVPSLDANLEPGKKDAQQATTNQTNSNSKESSAGN